jgi:DNA-binding CsgD family transcriptional regulator
VKTGVRRFFLGGHEFAVISVHVHVPDGAALTRAERETAELLARGMTNREIARARGTSTNTVANQIKSVFRKLGVQSRAELVTVLVYPA